MYPVSPKLPAHPGSTEHCTLLVFRPLILTPMWADQMPWTEGLRAETQRVLSNNDELVTPGVCIMLHFYSNLLCHGKCTIIFLH